MKNHYLQLLAYWAEELGFRARISVRSSVPKMSREDEIEL